MTLRPAFAVLVASCVTLAGCGGPEPDRAPSWMAKQTIEAAFGSAGGADGGEAVRGVRFVPQTGHGGEVRSISLSKDARYALSGAEDGSVNHWDLGTGRLLRSIHRPSSTTYAVALSPDGTVGIVAGVDDQVILREMLAREGDGAYEVHKDNHFALRVYDLKQGKVTRKLPGHARAVRGLALLPGAPRVLSCSEDGTARVWDVVTGAASETFSHGGKVLGCAVSPDGKLAATAGDDKAVKVWGIGGGAPKVLSGSGDELYAVAFAPDGKSIAAAGKDRRARAWDTASGRLLFTTEPHQGAVRALAFTPDGKSLLSTGPAERGARAWDARTGAAQRSVGEAAGSALATAGRAFLVGAPDATLTAYDVQTGEVMRAFTGGANAITTLAFSGDGNTLLAAGPRDVSVWDVPTLHRARRFEDDSPVDARSVAFSADAKSAVTGSEGGKTLVWNVESGHVVQPVAARGGVAGPYQARRLLIAAAEGAALVDPSGATVVTLPLPASEVRGWATSPEGAAVVVQRNDGSLQLFALPGGKLVRTLNAPGATWPRKPRTVALTTASNPPRVYAFGGGGNDSTLGVFNLSTGEYRDYPQLSRGVTGAAFSADGLKLFLGTEEGAVHVFDTNTAALLTKLEGAPGPVTSVALGPRGRLLALGTSDGALVLRDLVTRRALTLLSEGSEWLVYDDLGYFDSSRSGADLVAMVKGLEAFSVEQFAIRNNRPDLLLTSMLLGSPDLVAHYESRYRRRLSRAGIEESRLRGDLHVPEAGIREVREEGKFATVSFAVSDRQVPLRRYNVYVNGVPLFGAYGKEVTGSEAALTERVELTPGQNRIEVTAINGAGAESYRAQRTVTYAGKAPGNLVYLGFGVSKYHDSRLDLSYAHKDALDLAAHFKAEGRFAKVDVHTFVDDQVTPDAFKRAKAVLEKATVDDTVIVFIAGHGVHARDREGTYYYLVHETAIAKLAETAVTFETIEDLLQGIPPRKKLFLMDTCESGDVDDEPRGQVPLGSPASARGTMRGRSVRGLVLAAAEAPVPLSQAVSQPAAPPPRRFLLQRDRFVYNDLSRRTGAIVFSSSQGSESSYESDEAKNGYFTREILTALATPAADKDRDGWVNTVELRDYVSRAVAKRTNGMQNPTIDRDNPYQRVALPLTH